MLSTVTLAEKLSGESVSNATVKSLSTRIRQFVTHALIKLKRWPNSTTLKKLEGEDATTATTLDKMFWKTSASAKSVSKPKMRPKTREKLRKREELREKNKRMKKVKRIVRMKKMKRIRIRMKKVGK